MIGEKLTLRWGQPVIIENKPGGALHLGTEAVARSAPDGYTLLLAPQGPLVLSPSLYRKLSYDPVSLRAGHGAGAAALCVRRQSERAGVEHCWN